MCIVQDLVVSRDVVIGGYQQNPACVTFPGGGSEKKQKARPKSQNLAIVETVCNMMGFMEEG